MRFCNWDMTFANGQKRWLHCICKTKHGTVLPVNTYMEFCVVSPILEQTLHLSSFDSKDNARIEEIIKK